MLPEVVNEENPVAILAEIKEQEIAEITTYNGKKKSPYRKWLQVNNDAYNDEDWLMKNSPTAYRILRFLVLNMDKYNAVICSYKVMQEKLGYSKPTVERAIRLLKERKYIEVAKSGTSNIYMINKKLYWNSWGYNYAYAEFGANVIISSSEQEKFFQKELQLEIKKRQEVTIRGKHD